VFQSDLIIQCVAKVCVILSLAIHVVLGLFFFTSGSPLLCNSVGIAISA